VNAGLISTRYVFGVLAVGFIAISDVGAGGVGWRSDAVSITTSGLLCGPDAQRVLDVHKSHRAPLEPSEQVSPNLTSDAVLGLVVQVRGREEVQNDVRFELGMRFRSLERRYDGKWKAHPGSNSGGTVWARTTDWWIRLERLFSKSEIDELCRASNELVVEVLSVTLSRE